MKIRGQEKRIGWLIAALTYTGVAIICSLIFAAFLANLALKPIEQIGARLDALALAEAEVAGEASNRSGDAVVLVSHNALPRTSSGKLSRMRARGGVVSTMSGGLDSTLVTAVAARQLASQEKLLDVFTYVPGPGSTPGNPANADPDEGPWAGAVAGFHPNIRHHLVQWDGMTPLDIYPASHGISHTPVRDAAGLVRAAYQHYIERIGAPPGPMLEDYSAVLAAGHSWLAESTEPPGLPVTIKECFDLAGTASTFITLLQANRSIAAT